MEELLLGIDVGTTMVKAALFTTTGVLEHVAARPNPVYCPRPGWSECRMEVVWESAAGVVRDLLRSSGVSTRRLVGLGLTGNMGGAWLVGEDDIPVRSAILWNDGRAASLLRRWYEDGTLARIFATSLTAPAPGFTLPLLLWLRDYERHSLDRVQRLVFAKDWIRFHLTGQWATDPSEITHVPGDVATGYRSMGLLGEFGMERFAALFPPLREMVAVAGEVTGDAAHATGLPMGLPVVTGAGDVTATVVGMDATRPGRYSVIAGTSCLVNLSGARADSDGPVSGITFLTPVGLLRSQPNQTGTLALDWLARVLWDEASGTVHTKLQEVAERAPRGAGGLLFLPYLNSTGLVAPVYEPFARGQLFGLGLEHCQPHIARAVFEGLALAVADGIAHLRGGENHIRLAGGLARNEFWCQLVADVTGMEVIVPAGEELGALGACMLAAVSIGLYPDVSSAQAVMARIAHRYKPQSDRRDFYGAALEAYQAVRGALLPVFRYREQLAGDAAGDETVGSPQ